MESRYNALDLENIDDSPYPNLPVAPPGYVPNPVVFSRQNSEESFDSLVSFALYRPVDTINEEHTGLNKPTHVRPSHLPISESLTFPSRPILSDDPQNQSLPQLELPSELVAKGAKPSSAELLFREKQFNNGNWNEAFMRALAKLDSPEKWEQLTQLSMDFVDAAKVYND
jgi:hypothetical protein